MRCPGQDTRYWKDRDIFEVPCPSCGNIVEFFKDDTIRACRSCGKKVPNPRLDFGCALYCKFAEQCLGNLPKEIMEKKQELIKDRVAIEVKRFFKKDFKQISHAIKVARYAERIAKKEGADLGVVLCAAYLHDVGAPETVGLSGDEMYLEQERLSLIRAREILEGLGTPDIFISQVLGIVGHHHHPTKEESMEYRCVYDADQIVNFEENANNSVIALDLAEETKAKLTTTEGHRLLQEILERITRKEIRDEGSS